MVLNETLFAMPPEMIELFGSLVSSIKALGIAIIFYLVFSVINMIMNRRKEKEIREINSNLEDIKKLLRNQGKI